MAALTCLKIAGDENQKPAAGGEAPLRELTAFLATLFGRVLTPEDEIDLSDRIGYLLADPVLGRDCRRLALHLGALAARRGRDPFAACSEWQRESMVEEIMRIDYKSRAARWLSRILPGQRDFYRLRWSAVSQLAWMYRHSPVAWRARGYRHWPGVAGNWRDVLVAGPAYP